MARSKIKNRTLPRAGKTHKPRKNTGDASLETGGKLHALLAQRVRSARAQLGITRKQLAAQSGISLAYLARVEGGTGNISLGLLQKLSLALNIPIEDFLVSRETVGADFTLIVEFLKRQSPGTLARIRRDLFEKFAPSANQPAQRVALIGIRGVGKSTVGPMLARQLGVPFVELSREIEKEAGIALSEIIMLYGQQGYRQLERRCLERVVVSYPKVVLVTAGGIVTDPGAYELLRGSFYTIFMTGKPSAVFDRIVGQHDARLTSPLGRSEALAYISAMLEARKHLYDMAHASVDTTGKTPEQVVRALCAALPSSQANVSANKNVVTSKRKRH